MQMEAGPLPRTTPLLAAQTPHVLLPRNGIVFQPPVLGGLQMPATPATRASSLHRSRPVEQLETPEATIPHALDLSPGSHVIVVDVGGGPQSPSAGRLQTVDELRRGQRVLQARHDVPRRAPEGAPWPWPPRSDSMENMNSVPRSRPRDILVWSDDDLDIAFTDSMELDRQTIQLIPGGQGSSSLRGRNHMVRRDGISREADEREPDHSHGWSEQLTDVIRQWRR